MSSFAAGSVALSMSNCQDWLGQLQALQQQLAEEQVHTINILEHVI